MLEPPPADVEVRVLGPFETRAPGPASGEHRQVLAALVAIAAVEPGGVPASVVGELLPQPGAVPAATHQLRRWLGADATGAPRLSERDGTWRLAPDVRVDWQVFRELVTHPDPASERRRLATALAMIRGELLAGVPSLPAAQPVLQPAIATIHAVVVQAVRRDVELAMAADDPARAEWALRQGLMLLPREEGLWRIRLEL